MTIADRAPVRAPRPTLMDRWYTFRDRVQADPKFQHWAARFPLTRPIARARQRALFDLVSGFVYSQALSAIVRLRVLDHLADGPRTLEDLASRSGLATAAGRRLFDAAAALRLLRHAGPDRYGLGDLGAALRGNPGVAAMVEHHSLLYDDLADPVALLRGEHRETKLSQYWRYAIAREPGALAADEVADYSRLMAVSQQFIAGEILDAYPLGEHRRLLDIGGGEGAFIRAAARHAPHLDLTLFDLPAVAARAEAGFLDDGITARARAVGGNMFADPLPTGADIACLIRVLYDHPRERALSILRAARAALPRGGRLLVAEPMANVKGAETVGAAYFGFYLLAMKGGDARSPAELEGLMREAGFTQVRPARTASPLLVSVLIAEA